MRHNDKRNNNDIYNEYKDFLDWLCYWAMEGLRVGQYSNFKVMIRNLILKTVPAQSSDYNVPLLLITSTTSSVNECYSEI